MEKISIKIDTVCYCIKYQYLPKQINHSHWVKTELSFGESVAFEMLLVVSFLCETLSGDVWGISWLNCPLQSFDWRARAMSLGVTAHTGGKTEAWLQMMWLPAEGETPWCVNVLFFFVFLSPKMTLILPPFENQKELKDKTAQQMWAVYCSVCFSLILCH